MKTLIIYDSKFGNTKQIAEAIGNAITGETKMLRAGEAHPADLQYVDLLIVGSPTQGGRPTPAVQQFLNSLPDDSLNAIKVVTFDTRFSEKEVNFALKLLMKTIGYAAPKIAKTLESKGGKLIVPPEDFIVNGKEGPLKDGEFERATDWANKLASEE